MSDVELRSYNHETDYEGLRTLLEQAELYDKDYESQEHLAALTERYPNMITVAAIGQEVVGSIYLQDGVIPEIHRLAVRKAHRRQGIASKLLEAAEQQARELGHSHVVLFVHRHNPAAMARYAKSGYLRGRGDYMNFFKSVAEKE